GMRTDVSEIIAYRAYFVFFCTGWFRIIAGNVLVGVSQIRLHIRAAPMVFTRRPRCGREEKRREEKRREEKRREEKRREEKRREVFCRPYAYQLRISKIKLLKRLLINAKHFIRFVLPGYDLFC
ncbi:TPA: hypothetical protein WLP75_001812, partial [Neisseria gonorrhoeae]